MVKDLEQQGKLQFHGFSDKRGKLMKFHFEVINSKNVGSVYNVHICAMYEGADCHQNMTLVLL